MPAMKNPTLNSLTLELGLQQMIGVSRNFCAVKEKIPCVARCDAGVLITGETGTGKELCARAIHYGSARAHGPFIPLNCGAIPVELIENELFGHQRGAFTDARDQRTGLLAEAQGGTLFLDEVDSTPPATQVKLLRFLQDKEYRPLGAAKALKADVRIIAATNADLATAIKTGGLRADLYYRLKIIQLNLPSLRERREDILLLAQVFLKRYAAEFASPAQSFSHEAEQLLLLHDWPGNVRELENLVANAAALASRSVIEPDDLDLPTRTATVCAAHSFREAKARFEQDYLETMLALYHGNVSQAAQAAQKNRRAFWELMRKYHIDAARFRNDDAFLAPCG